MTVQYCRKCGTKMLKKHAPESVAKQVRELTGQVLVWKFLCAVCYPEKVAAFLGKKPSKK